MLDLLAAELVEVTPDLGFRFGGDALALDGFGRVLGGALEGAAYFGRGDFLEGAAARETGDELLASRVRVAALAGIDDLAVGVFADGPPAARILACFLAQRIAAAVGVTVAVALHEERLQGVLEH